MEGFMDYKEFISDISKTLLSPLIIIGAFWYIAHDIKNDVDRIEKQGTEQIKEMKQQFKESDERWYGLLKDLHSHDKRIDRLESK